MHIHIIVYYIILLVLNHGVKKFIKLYLQIKHITYLYLNNVAIIDFHYNFQCVKIM